MIASLRRRSLKGMINAYSLPTLPMSVALPLEVRSQDVSCAKQGEQRTLSLCEMQL